MSNYAEVVVLVEGKTEQIFIQNIIAPYLVEKHIFMTPIIISKPGQKGGDIKFSRVTNDIKIHLKQRPDTFLTIFVDFYGIQKDWPALKEAKSQQLPEDKAEKLNSATKNSVNQMFLLQDSERRFIPYVSMHEFEALLFSEPQILANHLQIPRNNIDKIISKFGKPENIDDSPHSSPSKRIEKLSPRFKKTSTGIAIAKAIGLNRIREQCPIFNKWLTEIECINF